MSNAVKDEKKQTGSAHIPKVEVSKSTPALRVLLKNLFYDFVILFSNIVVCIFFREVSIRGSFNLPKHGPTIVVVAPHANQFVDAAVILTEIRKITNRNSPPIIAAVSLKRRVIGFLAKLADAIPVPRAQDDLKFVEGEIHIEEDPLRIFGKGTKFTSLENKGLIGLPNSVGNSEIQEIISDTELVVRKPFKGEAASNLLKKGTKFKFAPKTSNDVTFQHVFNTLHSGGIINIFPEGGSHDRPDLLPIKAGFAIMALGAVAADPSRPVQIIPTGLNYFHRNKFRSRAVVEFGTPIKVTAEDGEFYKTNPREAVSKLLDVVTSSLKAVTVTAPDFETLQVIQAARRLYAKKVPLSLINEINRKLITGYTHYKDDERIVHLKDAVLAYNKKLGQLGLKDHQVELAVRDRSKSLFALIYRILKLIFLFSLSLPGTILFSPILISTNRIAKRKQQEALAASVVKIKAIDVVASWKILIATVLAPALYISYSLLGTFLVKRYNILNSGSIWAVYLFIITYSVLVSTTYAAFRIGETGVDILKSLPPLISSVFGSEKELLKLKKERERLSLEVTEVVNNLGPKVFPDFDKFTKEHSKLIEGAAANNNYAERGRLSSIEESAEYRSKADSTSRSSSVSSVGLSRVNSEGYLSDIPILGDGSTHNSSSSDTSLPSSYQKIEQKYGATGSQKFEDTVSKLRKATQEKIEGERKRYE